MTERPSKPDSPSSYDDRSTDLQSMNASSFTWRAAMRAPVWRPPTDVYETDDTIVVRVEIAGMQDDDFSIELNRRYLTIRGIRPDVPERRAYHQMEIRVGEFSIDLELPFPVNVEQVEAVYNNGFLLISLPKASPRQIPIAE